MMTEKRILVVEDDFSIREIMRDAFEGEGYVVTTAENGQDAIDVLTGGLKPKLIILDMTMPVMNGREFLDLKISKPEIKAIPVLVVSAIADEKNTLGASAFIRKPVDLNVLLTLVERYFDSFA